LHSRTGGRGGAGDRGKDSRVNQGMNLTLRSLKLAIATTALLAACSDGAPLVPPPDPEVSVGELKAEVLDEVATAGEYIEVRFENLTAIEFLFSGCARGVERWVDGKWQAMPPELRLCIAMVDPIDAHSVRVLRIDVPADAVAGHYRFRFDLHRPTQSENVPALILRSTTFEVQ
jgi:hypothetical protein